LNLKEAWSVKKSCRWQVFSEQGAQAGTASEAARSPSRADCKARRILSSRPRRSKVRFASTFFMQKAIRPLPCFSFFTKSHARLSCSVVNALTTIRYRYQLL